MGSELSSSYYHDRQSLDTCGSDTTCSCQTLISLELDKDTMDFVPRSIATAFLLFLFIYTFGYKGKLADPKIHATTEIRALPSQYTSIVTLLRRHDLFRSCCHPTTKSKQRPVPQKRKLNKDPRCGQAHSTLGFYSLLKDKNAYSAPDLL